MCKDMQNSQIYQTKFSKVINKILKSIVFLTINDTLYKEYQRINLLFCVI